ncbi:hypothetical protein GGH13_005114 [Coemansia sp. S155-1]|nr:hypothetical protein GGH13_005114 [Coemansia sp. S155-1]
MNPLNYIPDGTDEHALNHFQLFNTMQIAFVISGMMVTIYFLLRIIDICSDLWIREPIPVESFGADKGYWAVLKDVMVESYAVDFSKATKEDWAHISTMVMSKEVGVLVNNVGVCHPAIISFMEESPEICKQMVNVNITTTMNMTRLVVPQMRERKNGLILNIGSWTAMKGMPFLPVYAGTKGFVKTFSQSLAFELEPEGITVEHIFSFWVRSKMSGYKTSSVSIPSPRVYARHVLTHIGLKCGTLESYSSVPYPPHSYLGFVSSAMWDSRITPPILYSIANNLYKLSVKRRQQIKLKNA